MSLINQMLQELDARRAEGTASAEYGQQVRAVPERRRIHPAWWVALALGIALLCVAGWALFRFTTGSSEAAAQKLPLKMETRLGTPVQAPPADAAAPSALPAPSMTAVPDAPGNIEASPAPSTFSAPGSVANAPTHASLPAVVPGTPPATPVARPQPEPETEAARNKSAAVSRQPAEETAAGEATMPSASPRAATSTRTRAAPSSPSEIWPEAPPSFASPKQPKELSQQQRAENEYRKALIAVEQGKTGDGISALETALQFDARHAAARQSLIGLLLNARRQDEAIVRAREGLAIDAAQPGLAMILARLQLEKGTSGTAIDTLERTLPHARDRADYLAFLAALLQREERHAQAAEYYFQALQRSPQNGVWWMGLGISLQADQKTAEASEAFRRAKSTNSLSPELTAFVNSRLSQLQR
ncbi:hypothetical protein RY831_27980 [Noviherbaspirillum sp. CPCC 100848]|uniref:Tetratricopeptide repeat protein n=1 Tax=Noviherbaspirillum album TaxID=3080276 RepID=A0ABU6JH66_9BURK|nr:hypothetical protein [Noviherbaspirillum sp. CPCC 100848]MEC4723004.1 hypothetical protein [Noviherbaspirillum sp. CPCC 100848]